MAGQDTGGQERATARPSDAEEVVEESGATAAADAAERKANLDADVDAILDEIDEVLETNSEDFVRAFVQKGGQ
jgi:prokaryotic ubiquitin-like protein Pup